jgi:hypothetical protein
MKGPATSLFQIGQALLPVGVMFRNGDGITARFVDELPTLPATRYGE